MSERKRHFEQTFGVEGDGMIWPVADMLIATSGQQGRDLTASWPIPCKRQPIYAAQLLTND